MDFEPRYQSPLGYRTGNNGIDSYGVNHKNFSLRDELEYQLARHEREQRLMNGYNARGINKNYPQFGTDFWGNPENNYGFGQSNVAQNIAQNQLKHTSGTPITTNRQPPYQEQYAVNQTKSESDNYDTPKEAYTSPEWGQQTSKRLQEYMQNDHYHQEKTRTGLIAPFNDLIRNYKKMRNINLIGADNFFHCKANYEAANRGLWGNIVGKTISFGREALNLIQGDTLADSLKDWNANRKGWEGAEKGLPLRQACPTNPKEYLMDNEEFIDWY